MKCMCTVFAMFLIFISVSAPTVANEADWMPDANLQTAVRSALSIADDEALTKQDMANLTSLTALNLQISSITGLEHATNLTSLNLRDNTISDISALSGLTNLTSLNLRDNTISDISALSGLTNLETLKLQGNTITDISALSGLTSLTFLNLKGNNISAVSALSGLTTLEFLKINENSITDVTPLATLVNLETLYLADNLITDLSPLVTLVNLTKIDFDLPESDTTAPDVSISVPSDVQTGVFDAIITFTEAVSSFDHLDVSLSGTATASITSFTTSDNTAYTATIRPTSDGTVILDVAADVATDAANNPNTAATPKTVTVTIADPQAPIVAQQQGTDTVAPDVSISVPLVPQNSAFDVIITFTEAVSDFERADVSLGGTATASITDWHTTDNTVFTATITPTTSGEVTLDIEADVATDAASNGNTAAPQQTVTIQMPQRKSNSAPVFNDGDSTTRSVDKGTYLPQDLGAPVSATDDDGDLLTYTLSGPDEALFTVDATNGQLRNVGLLTYEDKTSYSVIITVSDSNGGTDTITVTITDDKPPVVEILTYIRQDVPPWVLELDSETGIVSAVIPETYTGYRASDLDEASFTRAAGVTFENTFSVSISFDEVVSGLKQTDLTLTDNTAGASVIDWRAIEGWTRNNTVTQYRAEIAVTQSGSVTFNVAADVASDSAGNSNAASESKTVTVTITLTDHPPWDVNEDGSVDATDSGLVTAAMGQSGDGIVNIRTDVDWDGTVDVDDLALVTYHISDTTLLRVNIDARITFSDTNLAAAVRSQLGLADDASITSQVILSLTTLSATNSGISNLSGLEYATNLEELKLDGNQISDISSLENLTNLTLLWLTGKSSSATRISDISPLAGLTDLTNLSLSSHEISDISDLGNLTNLTKLYLDNNSISDISSLTGLTNLTYLALGRNSISDISNLADLTNLTALYLGGNSISDISNLADLTNLTRLDLGINQISDISDLAGLTDLTHLYLSYNQIRDVTPLAGLVELQRLELRDNPIRPSPPTALSTLLTTLTKLNYYDIKLPDPDALIPDQGLARKVRTALGLAEDAEITAEDMLDLTSLSYAGHGWTVYSLDGLEHATNLTDLRLNSYDIGDISSLAGLTNLTDLDLGGNSLDNDDLTHLSGLTNLTHLNLYGNKLISDLTHLSGLTNLTELLLFKCNISDLNPLSDLTNLTSLTLSDNPISNLSPLSRLTTLQYLSLHRCSISDISPLSGLVNLFSLELYGNSISDVTSIANLVKLKFLKIEGNPILDTSPLYPLLVANGGVLLGIDIDVSQYPPWDVNEDGNVDATDSALVAAALGQTGDSIVNSRTDVNGDGTVDADDLTLVTNNLDTNGGAPSSSGLLTLLDPATLEKLDPATLEAQLEILRAKSDGSMIYLQAIALLESTLAALRPEKTVLLANYPNPFNPETWIPYQLAAPSNVRITIYDARGILVRQLDLGHQREGYYTSRSRAAYWDGRNDFGERVASGIYFYQFQADNMSLLRKMLILK